MDQEMTGADVAAQAASVAESMADIAAAPPVAISTASAAATNKFVVMGLDYWDQGVEVAKDWLLSAGAWSQFGLLVVAFLAAWYLNRTFGPKLTRLLTPAKDSEGIFSQARRFVCGFLPLLLPVLAYAFTAMGEEVTRTLFGSGAVIAFGKRAFLFLAARIFVKQVLTSSFLAFLGRYVLVPVAALHMLGVLDPAMTMLNETVINLGNISFSVMSLVRGAIAGSLLFWMGGWSNNQSSTYIGRQEMRPAIQQLTIKAAEFTIFGIAFLLLMSIMGISLTSLAVFGGALGVGLGLGLQKIASNFISGVILLVEGQATVGDYVELDGGEAGRIHSMGARATILETYDGRWIVVPNEDFITTRVINYSDAGSANRYEADFSVSYDTDINKIPAIIEAAVSKHPEVLQEPEAPDCELRGFGDSGIDFSVEFWVNGIDDGTKKYTSDVLFLVWNALKDNNIEIPYPHRVIEIKGKLPE